jgi:hypothetical protein
LTPLTSLPLTTHLSPFTSAPAEAATADTLNFQGRLLTSAGALVPDGTYNVEFNLYNVLTLANCGSGGSGVTTIGALNGGTANANGATITGTTLYLQSASASFAGVVDTTAQTFAGVKTFNNNVVLAAGATLRVIGDTTVNRPAGTPGELYYDTDTNTLLTYNGTKWVADRGEYIIVAANDSTQAEKDSADYVADGTADQTEINSALTLAAGGKVLLLAGTYTIDAAINVPSNTTLSGSGDGSLITIANALNPAGLNMVSVGASTNVTVRDLAIDGNDENQATSGVVTRGVYATGAETAVLNIDVHDIETHGVYLSGADSIVQENYIDCDASTTSSINAAIGIFSGGNNVSISNNYLRDCSTSIFIEADWAVVDGNTIWDGGSGLGAGNGIYANTANNAVISNNNVSLNFDTAYGIRVISSQRVTVDGNNVADSFTIIEFSSTLRSVISNNVFDDSDNTTINIDASSHDNIITGNMSTDTTGQGRTLIYSNENVISNNSQAGGRLFISGDNNVASNNQITNVTSGAEGNGIDVSGDGNLIIGNITNDIALGEFHIEIDYSCSRYCRRLHLHHPNHYC